MKHDSGSACDRWLLVDGYNIIGAWEWLRQLAEEDIAAARDALSSALLDYAGWTGKKLLLVFDAYAGKEAEKLLSLDKKGESWLVYTRKGQTADQYIERFVRERPGEFIVASSDGLVQVMIFAYARRLSARELAQDMERKQAAFQKKQQRMEPEKLGLFAQLDASMADKLEAIRRGEATPQNQADTPPTTSPQSKKNKAPAPPPAQAASPGKKKRPARRRKKTAQNTAPSTEKTAQSPKEKGKRNGIQRHSR